MFTGIIENLGTIKSIDGNRFCIKHGFIEPFVLGESIALSGMCATVVAIKEGQFEVEIIEESRNKTIFGACKTGDQINLERAAKIGQRNSGHFVLGHIDQLGGILNKELIEDYWLFRISIDSDHRPWLVYKGSVAIDGISLTVSQVSALSSKKAWLEVSIIPHTLECTTLRNAKIGDALNIEFDILGKYALNQAELPF